VRFCIVFFPSDSCFVDDELLTASGLLWLSELIEEHSKFAKVVGKKCIYVRLSLKNGPCARSANNIVHVHRPSSQFTSYWHSQIPCHLTRSRSPYSATLYTCKISPTRGQSSPFPPYHSSRRAFWSSSTILCGSSISHMSRTRRVRCRTRHIAAGPW
jgi:hypothetical protein